MGRQAVRQWFLQGIISVAAVAMFSATAWAGTTLPQRKAGYWVSSMVMHMNMAGQAPDTDNTPMITAMCTDPATDLKVLTTPPFAQCSPPDISGSGNTYTMVMSCKDPMGGAQPMVSTSTFTFASDTEMHLVSKTTGTSMTGDETADSKWQGSCPAGWVPGDVGRMQNGSIQKNANVLKPAGQ
ncbi:MAG: hypothetical protein B7Z75_12565 [Acidocella sp. 20-57-95]|nr:MAG: hypothetical protein B7Z75_12565 [Acidocella sp. 20-57-95]OYV62388.1 MAG: hypothetical protein B7Z71_01400 [Acidocella sp. 21-58-7]HQT63102.1 hypothetical protein [Acidocella sp.]HQU03821.1 hypothetical protein [Acidocella sp.]